MILTIFIVACLVLMLDKTGFLCTEDVEKLIYSNDGEVSETPNPGKSEKDISAEADEALSKIYEGDGINE